MNSTNKYIKDNEKTNKQTKTVVNVQKLIKKKLEKIHEDMGTCNTKTIQQSTETNARMKVMKFKLSKGKIKQNQNKNFTLALEDIYQLPWEERRIKKDNQYLNNPVNSYVVAATAILLELNWP